MKTSRGLSTLAVCMSSFAFPAAPGAQDSVAVDKRRFDILDFEGIPAGTVLEAVYGRHGLGPVGVHGTNPLLGAVDAAVVFDSSDPTGGDFDLGTPNEDFGGPGVGEGGSAGSPFQNDRALGRTLIVASSLVDGDGDGLVDDPGDVDVDGSRLSLDFSEFGVVTLHAITVIDVEGNGLPPVVAMYDAEGGLIGDPVDLPLAGDNGVARVRLGAVPGVASMDVILNGSAAIDEVLFEIAPKARIHGRVWDDLDGDGIQDRGEPGLAGVVVTLASAAAGPPLATETNAGGVWQFKDLDAGTYTLDVDPASLPQGAFPSPCDAGDDDSKDSDCAPVTLTLGAGQISTTTDFGFDSECDGAIGDTVFFDVDGDDLQSPGDVGIGGALVRLLDEAGTELATAITDADGRYLFERLCPGLYQIYVRPGGTSLGIGSTVGPVACNVGGDESIDSECGPVCVQVFPFALGSTIDSSIDFGFRDCGDCVGQMTSLSLHYSGETSAFVEVFQNDGTNVYSDDVAPDESFSFFGTRSGGRLGPQVNVFVDGVFHGEIHTSCSQPIFIGLTVGKFEIVAGASHDGGTLCLPD